MTNEELTKRILKLLESTVNEMQTIIKELKSLSESKEDAYKVKLSEKARNGH